MTFLKMHLESILSFEGQIRPSAQLLTERQIVSYNQIWYIHFLLSNWAITHIIRYIFID